VAEPDLNAAVAIGEGCLLIMETTNNGRLTGSQFARIARTLAEPRRLQILKGIAASADPMPRATLKKNHQISAATLSHHTKDLETASLIKIVRKNRFATLILQRHVVRAYLERLSRLIDPSDVKEESQMSRKTLS
jgi:ArsR family transcriptional regulator